MVRACISLVMLRRSFCTFCREASISWGNAETAKYTSCNFSFFETWLICSAKDFRLPSMIALISSCPLVWFKTRLSVSFVQIRVSIDVSEIMQVKTVIRLLPLTEVSYPEQSTSALCIPLNGSVELKLYKSNSRNSPSHRILSDYYKFEDECNASIWKKSRLSKLASNSKSSQISEFLV